MAPHVGPYTTSLPEGTREDTTSPVCAVRQTRHHEAPDAALPCIRPPHDDGLHRDALGRTWLVPTPELRDALALLCAAEGLRQILTGPSHE